MITKQSPEGQYLTVAWRTMLSLAGPVSEQYRGMLTGLAAILGLMVANLDSIEKVVCDSHLKWSLSLLIVSVLLASIAYLMSSALKVRNDVIYQLEQMLGSADGQVVLSQLTADPSELRRQLCRPFFGPIRWLMERGAKKGANEPFLMEKGGITLIVWQAYAMWLSILLAASGLIVLVIGLN